MDTSDWRHPKHNDLYTPVTDEVLQVIKDVKALYVTWPVVAFHTGMRDRILRRYLKGQHTAMSMTTMDRLLVALGRGHLNDFLWFTADDMMELGLWKKTQYVHGREATKDGQPGVRKTKAQRKAERRAREKEKKRKARAKEKLWRRWEEMYGWERPRAHP